MHGDQPQLAAAPSNSCTRTLYSYEEQQREMQFHGLRQAARMRALVFADSTLLSLGMLLLIMRPLTGTNLILSLPLPCTALLLSLILIA